MRFCMQSLTSSGDEEYWKLRIVGFSSLPRSKRFDRDDASNAARQFLSILHDTERFAAISGHLWLIERVGEGGLLSPVVYRLNAGKFSWFRRS